MGVSSPCGLTAGRTNWKNMYALWNYIYTGTHRVMVSYREQLVSQSCSHSQVIKRFREHQREVSRRPGWGILVAYKQTPVENLPLKKQRNSVLIWTSFMCVYNIVSEWYWWCKYENKNKNSNWKKDKFKKFNILFSELSVTRYTLSGTLQLKTTVNLFLPKLPAISLSSGRGLARWCHPHKIEVGVGCSANSNKRQ